MIPNGKPTDFLGVFITGGYSIRFEQLDGKIPDIW